jgi:hypothetical protein
VVNQRFHVVVNCILGRQAGLEVVMNHWT